MLQLWDELIARLTIDELELFLVQAWIIWNQRNAMIHGKQLQAPGVLNRRVEDYMEEFRRAQSRLVTRPLSLKLFNWRPPPLNHFKLNFDAAIFKDEEAFGFGAIIQNELGEVMAAFSGKGPSVSCSEEAEILACRRAVEYALEALWRWWLKETISRSCPLWS